MPDAQYIDGVAADLEQYAMLAALLAMQKLTDFASEIIAFRS